MKNSNTTLVKVKFGRTLEFRQVFKIQIQHLLKLNLKRMLQTTGKNHIQIQHLLKLNKADLTIKSKAWEFKYNTC